VVVGIQGSPSVHAELESRPESVALVRALLTGAVELLEFEPPLADDLNTAVSEACNNVVLHAYGDTAGPMIIHLEASAGGVEVSVRDHGGGFRHATGSGDRLGTGIAVISALADRAEFFNAPGGGTEVRIAFDRRATAGHPLEQAAATDRTQALPDRQPGEVAVTLSPKALLPGILGRMTRVLAARANFSLERFSDTYLLVESLAAHAENHAMSPHISFGLHAYDSELNLKIGPLVDRPDALLAGDAASTYGASRFERLVDDLAVKPVDHSKMLCLVFRDDEHV
jgi:serine/threonine-protein kinase RsbW